MSVEDRRSAALAANEITVRLPSRRGNTQKLPPCDEGSQATSIVEDEIVKDARRNTLEELLAHINAPLPDGSEIPLYREESSESPIILDATAVSDPQKLHEFLHPKLF